jgi:hypothetical protein
MGGVMVDYLIYVMLGLIILTMIRSFLVYRRTKAKAHLINTGLCVVSAGLVVALLLLRLKHKH